MKNLLIAFLLFVVHNSFAQLGEWTWMSGSNLTKQKGVYGPPGVFKAVNKPGARAMGGSFTDASGNFWLFGGQGYGYNKDTLGQLNDLWKYDPNINKWAFINGDTAVDALPFYGVKGVSSPYNNPGARSDFACWGEVGGALWLFGKDQYNDLWKYDLSTNEWTWMSGDSTGFAPAVYGVKGVASATNNPGARSGSCATWVGDGHNTLWLFGGYYSNGVHNDLWKYDISTNQWTWMSGDSGNATAGYYGIKGLSSPFNAPAPRMAHCSWKDVAGNFWLFGGSLSNDLYNDLWKFDPLSNEWTWISGDSTLTTWNIGGHYGSQCVEDNLNVPFRRCANSARWSDQCGNLIMYGGHDTGADLWSFNIASSDWTWVSGDSNTFLALNSPAFYGVKGISSPLNRAGTRQYTFSWRRSNGELWLFGGIKSPVIDFMNDLWRYVPDPACHGCYTLSAASPVHKTLDIYPNPSTGFFKITNPGKEFEEYLIRDITGRQILNDHIMTEEFNIDISDANAGIYFITLSNSVSNQVFKLIKY